MADNETVSESVKVRMTPEYETCMNELIGAALALDSFEVDEYDVLAKIMVKAGAAWRCCECNGINRLKNKTCDNCEARRPKERDLPRRESLHWDKEN